MHCSTEQQDIECPTFHLWWTTASNYTETGTTEERPPASQQPIIELHILWLNLIWNVFEKFWLSPRGDPQTRLVFVYVLTKLPRTKLLKLDSKVFMKLFPRLDLFSFITTNHECCERNHFQAQLFLAHLNLGQMLWKNVHCLQNDKK